MIAQKKKKNQERSFLRSFILWGPAEQYFRQTKIPRYKVPVRNISWELANSQKNRKALVNEEKRAQRISNLSRAGYRAWTSYDFTWSMYPPLWAGIQQHLQGTQ